MFIARSRNERHDDNSMKHNDKSGLVRAFWPAIRRVGNAVRMRCRMRHRNGPQAEHRAAPRNESGRENVSIARAPARALRSRAAIAFIARWSGWSAPDVMSRRRAAIALVGAAV